MSAAPDVPPALTPGEWATVLPVRTFRVVHGGAAIFVGPGRVAGVAGERGLAVNPQTEFAAVLALANAALRDGDPRKLTRAMLVAAEDAAQDAANASEHPTGSATIDAGDRAYVAELRALARALAALLPPEAT